MHKNINKIVQNRGNDRIVLNHSYQGWSEKDLEKNQQSLAGGNDRRWKSAAN